MNYRSIADLNKAIKSWIPELPRDLELIVGIPRSGLLAATLLSLYLNLPLTDVNGLCEGRVLATGRRFDGGSKPDLWKRNKVLVVDDSINSGAQMNEVKAKLEAMRLPHQLIYAAVYATPNSHCHVDYWYEIVDNPRYFEWNVMHHHVLINCCVDIDGVLCRDPTPEENDDGERYQRFLRSVMPLVVPTKPIGWLVTCRLEKYRELTEQWLSRHGIRYEQLIMMDLPDKETRVAIGNYAKFKAEVYKSIISAGLFIESSLDQARAIAHLAGKPVLCTENAELINPNFVVANCTRGKKFLKEAISNPRAASVKLLKFFIHKLSMLRWKLSAKVKKRHVILRGREDRITSSRMD